MLGRSEGSSVVGTSTTARVPRPPIPSRGPGDAGPFGARWSNAPHSRGGHRVRLGPVRPRQPPTEEVGDGLGPPE